MPYFKFLINLKKVFALNEVLKKVFAGKNEEMKEMKKRNL